MKITWIGHSCFKVESGNNSIVFDPYEDGSVNGLGNVREHAQLVLCSHEHFDHNARETVTIDEGTCAFRITVLDTYHDDKEGALRGTNKIHIIDDGTVRLAHLGDLGCSLTAEQIEVLKNVDVMLIPVGGYYTIDAQKADEIVKQTSPTIVIPMHYRGNTFGFDVIDTVDTFSSYAGNAITLNDCTLEVSDAYRGKTVIMTPKMAEKE